MSYPTSPDGDATPSDPYLEGIMNKLPADPAAIDLDKVRSNWSLECPMLPDLQKAIAAVEALRERVTELKIEKQGGWECLIARATAAEAREAMLAEALEPLIDDDECRLDHSGFCQTHTNELDDGQCAMVAARTALATTRPQAMERARAVDEVITTARCIAECRAYRGAHRGVEEALRSDLAKLDALGKEERRNDDKIHPLAFKHNDGGFIDGNDRKVVAGDHVEYKFENHRRGVLDEALQDGDAFVTWDNGSHATVKWRHLAKIVCKKETTP